MDFKPLVFVAEVNGQEFRFAALTMREMDQLIEGEKDLKGLELKKHNCETLAAAMRRAGEEVTAEEIENNLTASVFRALMAAFLSAHGLQMEAKTKPQGEAKPS